MVWAFQPSSRWAFEALPIRASTSAGRVKPSSKRTWSFQSSPTCAKAASQNSRTEWPSPVASTKSSGSSCWSIRHMPSTYSGAKPQSRTASRLPSVTWSSTPASMAATALVILRVTKFSPRRGDSWLNRIPETANSP